MTIFFFGRLQYVRQDSVEYSFTKSKLPMAKTITLPKKLLFETRSLADVGIEELLDDDKLARLLSEESDVVRFSPPAELMQRVFAYSASHRAHHSELLNQEIPVFLN